MKVLRKTAKPDVPVESFGYIEHRCNPWKRYVPVDRADTREWQHSEAFDEWYIITEVQS